MQNVHFSRKSRDKGLILKHVSTADGWDAQEVEDCLQLEDGGMLNRLVVTLLIALLIVTFGLLYGWPVTRKRY